MAQEQASHPNPGYCEFCGPGCSHCFGTPLTDAVTLSRKDQYGIIGGLAFDPASDKWVCAADFDYEAAEARRA